MDLSKLQDKFSPDDIEWRIGRAGYTKDGRPYGFILPYITNRAIMTRLDDVCGSGKWKNEFREWQVAGRHGVICGLSIRVSGEWITKWDGAENTDIEPLKGGLSDAMKRAGVQWGIGRYLYDLGETFAMIDEKGSHFAKGTDKSTGKAFHFRWNPPALPSWALPTPTVKRQKTPTAPVFAEERRVSQPTHSSTTRFAMEQAPAHKRP